MPLEQEQIITDSFTMTQLESFPDKAFQNTNKWKC